ncbi:hypothetical protein GCM10010465_24370 [Actinomadura fibrosa]
MDIVQDSLGFMWFATQDGLNRYDGQDFKIFPEVFDDVTSPGHSQLGKLLISGSKLWFVSKGGNLKVMDLCTEKITSVEKIGHSEFKLPPVSAIYVDAFENLWIGTLENGLFYWNTEKNLNRHYSKNSEAPFRIAGNQIRSIFGDQQGQIWVITSNGVTAIGGGGKETRNYLRGINGNTLTQDREGRLWLGTFGEGLFVREKQNGNFHLYQGPGKDKIPETTVIEAIQADKDGKLWIGTYGNGLYLLELDNGKITHLLPQRNNPYSLGFQDVLSIYLDMEGSLWVGTDGGGVSYYNSHFHNFSSLTARQVAPDISIEQIRAITTDSAGGVWLGTSGKGLTHLPPDREGIKTFHLEPYRPGISNHDRIVSLLADEEGDLWIGTQGNGLILKDINSGKFKKWFFSEATDSTEIIPDNTVWSMLEAGQNRIFAATRNAGLLLLDKENGLLRAYPEPGSLKNDPKKMNIRSVARVNDSILALGSELSALYLLNTCKGKFKRISNSVIENTLKEEFGIKCLYYDQGFLWAGTSGRGILVTHLKSNTTTSLTSENGLPNEMIYGILPGDDQSLWISSNRGIFRLTFQVKNNRIHVEQVQPFTVGNGLQSNEFNTGAFHKGKNNLLYFGGINGLNFFHPSEIGMSRESAPVVLTQAMVGNKPLQADSVITYKKLLKLPYNKNSVSFNYTILDYLSPETMNYEYRLEGHDENWIEAGERKYIAYTNLPPGDYTLKVKPASNIIPNAQPALLGILIDTPFWLTWWFVLLVVFLIIGAFYVFYRYRINQVLEVQRVKNNISSDLHDDIGSRLTSIQFLSALSRRKFINGEDTRSYLEGIDEEVQASSEALNEIVWNIKMDDESLEDIVAKMRRYTGEVFENFGITYNMEIGADFKGKKMGMQKRREIFLIFKELLNNIRKHSEATSINIYISVQRNMFYLSVADDGKGFDPTIETQRHGLKNLRARIEKWKGEININSELNRGCKVEIWLPFDKYPFWRELYSSFRRKEASHPKR